MNTREFKSRYQALLDKLETLYDLRCNGVQIEHQLHVIEEKIERLEYYGAAQGYI